MEILRTAVALVAALALASCAPGDAGRASESEASPSATPAGDSSDATGTAVDVVNIAFKPASVEVSPGDTVTWSSADAGVAHTVTSGTPGGDAVPGVSKATPARPDGAFDGPLDDSGSTFSHRFDEPGAYAYFCAVHPSMTGEVVVR